MYRYSVVIFIAVYLTLVDGACSPPTRYYVSCGSPQSLANAKQICAKYGMILLNLTNSSTLTADVAELNRTMISLSCTSNFWFASGNTTGYIANVNTLGGILMNLLGGVGLLLGAVLDLVGCLLLLPLCLLTTTPPPITSAMIVCVRPLQQQVIQKCQLTSMQSNIKIFQFHQAPMYGGILDSFPLNSRTACISLCASNNQCTGISYINGICNLCV